MSILIKDMEMPTERESFNLTIKYNGTVLDTETGMQIAEAHEIPPHGRSIDADKQDAQIEALIERHLHGYTKSTWDFICELRDTLKRNPTVIQKDSAEEEKNDK